MEKNTLKTKERLLVFLIVFLILLVPISVLFGEKKPSVQINNFNIEKINDSSQRLSFAISNVVSDNMYCKVLLQFMKNDSVIKEEERDIGIVKKGESKDINFIVTFPSGNTTLRIKPKCDSAIAFP